MNDNPYQSPESTGKLPNSNAAVIGRYGLTFLGVLIALGLLVALLLPAMRPSRESVRRAQCTNNLKQIALGLLKCEEQYGVLPPAHTVDADGRPLHSWRTLILPFIDQPRLYDYIDLTKPWDDPANKVASETVLASYMCPTTFGTSGHTTYLAVLTSGGCFQATEGRKLSDITDPHDSTIMLIEVDAEHSVPWMCPADADLDLVLGLTKSESLAHNGRYNVATVNGRVFSVETSVDANKLRAMISIAGGDDAELDGD